MTSLHFIKIIHVKVIDVYCVCILLYIANFNLCPMGTGGCFRGGKLAGA
jgi:hypothetical protein